LRLSGADRRRTGDQLRSESRARRRNSTVTSVHTFHKSILRSIAAFNNGTYGPTVDQRTERHAAADPETSALACGKKRCLIPALNRATCGVEALQNGLSAQAD
jgi:hypothetical protein